jgi:hypothetical protein
MDALLRQPVVFVSAASADLKDARERLEEILRAHGAKVKVQKDYPTELSSGNAIERAIKDADLVICLIGHAFGTPLPAGDLPPEFADHSWTQWECQIARRHAKDYWLYFYDGPTPEKAEEEEFCRRQQRFREQVGAEEKGTRAGKFRQRFKTVEALEESILEFIRNENGALAQFRAGTWATIRSAYRAFTVRDWNEKFCEVSIAQTNKSAAEGSGSPHYKKLPFIASQGFRILVPGEGLRQSEYLKPAGFLPGRDTEVELRARGDAKWNPVTRDDLRDALQKPADTPVALGSVEISHPRRLFLVSGGGVGKTTNMRWLEAELNDDVGSGAFDVLAVRVEAGRIVARDDLQVLDVLAEEIANHVGAKGNVWTLEAIRFGLLHDAAAGRLILLIDGLDHVKAGTVPLLTSIQSDAPGRYWSVCSFVVAGRPHAVKGWKDQPARAEKIVATSRWRFLEPVEFTAREAEIFLGTSRYRLVEDKLDKLIQVPRVLEYVRQVPHADLVDVRTSADIYEKATRELIKRTLAEGGEDARSIGPNADSDRTLVDAPPGQIKYIMELMSALAFISLCPTTDPTDPVERDSFSFAITDYVQDEVWARVGYADDLRGSKSRNLARDFAALARFAGILGNGLLDATDTDTDTLNTIVWSNRTIHQFLAAHWFARHALGIKALSARLDGKPVDEEPEHKNRDADRLRNYVFHPELEDTDVTYELNQFLAEMPVVAIEPSSWVAAASAWYDPGLHLERGREGPRKWSTEMIYRSWATMFDIAGRPFDDWWDIPYGLMSRRVSASAHAQRKKLPPDPAARRMARRVLDRFIGDFDTILRGEHGRSDQAIAREMIAAENWIKVPGGVLHMGAPVEKQGFPGKVEAYWHQQLDDVQTGFSPQKAAERSTMAEWFTGAQGKALRAADTAWLAETFALVAPRKGEAPLPKPDRNAHGYAQALDRLRDKWSRPDETPAQNPQQIAAFTMHRFPVLRRWYYLFAPGHRDAVAQYLNGLSSSSMTTPPSMSAGSTHGHSASGSAGPRSTRPKCGGAMVCGCRTSRNGNMPRAGTRTATASRSRHPAGRITGGPSHFTSIPTSRSGN